MWIEIVGVVTIGQTHPPTFASQADPEIYKTPKKENTNMEAKKSDAHIVRMVKEAHRLAHVAINAVHGSGLPEHHEVASLAHALIAGRHVTAGSGGREVDHAGADETGDNLLDEAYSLDGEKSDGNR
ncbi:MAG TPA: hypothetical protein VMB18_04175 [Terriglobales bacterium]|nr:hypothetical protein [Terriglobales bacterium]